MTQYSKEPLYWQEYAMSRFIHQVDEVSLVRFEIVWNINAGYWVSYSIYECVSIYVYMLA